MKVQAISVINYVATLQRSNYSTNPMAPLIGTSNVGYLIRSLALETTQRQSSEKTFSEKSFYVPA